jgi:hypothetical protein
MPDSFSENDVMKDLRELDGHLQTTPLPGGSFARFRAHRDRIAGPRPFRRHTILAFATGLILLIALLPITLWPSRPADIMGFLVIERSDEFLYRETAESVLEVVRGRAVLDDSELGSRLAVSAGTRITREDKGIQVLRGRIKLRVKPRPPGTEPIHIIVSHGTIEVLGTSFTIRQDRNQGEVTLHAGRIRYRDFSGKAIDLKPQQTLKWPLEAEEEYTGATRKESPPLQPKRIDTQRDVRVAHRQKPVDADPPQPAIAPVEPVEPEPGFDSKTLMAQLEELRIQRRFVELVKRIRVALPHIQDRHLGEELSYEMGEILTYRIRDRRQGCQHWQHHLQQFPQRRNRAAIQDALKHLGCQIAQEL